MQIRVALNSQSSISSASQVLDLKACTTMLYLVIFLLYSFPFLYFKFWECGQSLKPETALTPTMNFLGSLGYLAVVTAHILLSALQFSWAYLTCLIQKFYSLLYPPPSFHLSYCFFYLWLSVVDKLTLRTFMPAPSPVLGLAVLHFVLLQCEISLLSEPVPLSRLHSYLFAQEPSFVISPF